MLARAVTCVANLLLAGMAYLFAMPWRALPLAAVLIGLALAATLAIDATLRIRSAHTGRERATAEPQS